MKIENRERVGGAPRPVGMARRNGPTLCVVVPTFNESENIEELVRRIEVVLEGIEWELIFVDDDSTDGTAALARAMGQRDARIRCIRRVGRRGLSSACIEGMMATTAPLVAVMDADLQHDEFLLPAMVDALADPGLDVVVGSRYVDGGGIGAWSADRALVSRAATRLAQVATAVALSDPMSGFFMLRASVAQEVVPRLSGIGFKILLDLLASSQRPLRCLELPFTFRTRHAGESKLDSRAAWDYLMLLGDKTIGRYVPIRFFVFALVGALGVVVHMLALSALFLALQASFAWAQGVATLVAMTSNFLINNALTYRDRRLKGLSLLRGWISFVLACAIGGVANVGVAAYLFDENESNWVLPAIAGIAVGAVWNYAVTAAYTWRTNR